MANKVVLPGGSGFLGEALAGELKQRGYDVVVLTRGPARTADGIRYLPWDGCSLGDWVAELDGARAVVNFSGKSVNCLYTRANKAEILSSRLNSVRVLQAAISASSSPPPVFVQAGSLAIYGDTENVCDERAPHGTGFSVQVCERWEEAFFAAELPRTRKVLLRIGFALGRRGGALEPLRKLAAYRLGGTIGSGRQYISWIHLDDLNAMFLEAIENGQLTGVYNATGPQPVTNKQFMASLRQALDRGWALPAPSLLVKLGAYTIMRAAPELALTGRNCIPARFTEANFRFRYERLDKALQDLLS